MSTCWQFLLSVPEFPSRPGSQQLSRQLESEQSTSLGLVHQVKDLQSRASAAEAANLRLTLLPQQFAKLQATHDKLQLDDTATSVKLEAANERISRCVVLGMSSLCMTLIVGWFRIRPCTAAMLVS